MTIVFWLGAALGGDLWTDPTPSVRLLERSTSNQHILAAYVDLCGDVQARATTWPERRQTTSAWARSVGAEVAINGAFFSYDDYDAIGWSIGDGEAWPTAVDYDHYTAIGFASYGRAKIFDQDVPLPPVWEGWWTEMVPGDPILVDDGVIVEEDCYSHMCSANPRTAIGLTSDDKTAILVTVDGRSSTAAGMTRADLASLMVDLGAWRAMNLDGGGSTTMWIDGLGVLNDPSDGSERVVASHLGFVPADAPTCCRPAPVDGASGVFGDMADGRWSKPYAEALYAAGITSGCQADPLLFCPDCVLDRATLGVFIARGLDLVPVAETSFVDVDSSAWYADEIEALKRAGITSGCDTDRYCPDRLATRWEAAAFVFRGMGILEVTPTGRFSDVSATQAPVLEALADACVLAGCGDGKFCPDDAITREQLAKILAIGFSVSPFAPCTPDDTDVPDDTDTPDDTDLPDDTDTPRDTDAIDPDGGDAGCGCGSASGLSAVSAVLLLMLLRRS